MGTLPPAIPPPHAEQVYPDSDYTPVDTSFDARRSWPHTYLTEPQLNGRELGQFVAGIVFGAGMRDERAWLFTVPTDKVAAVSAALIDRGCAVAREHWDDHSKTTCLAIWSGL